MKEWAVEDGVLCYEIRNAGAVVTAFRGTAATVVIPGQLDTVPVTGVGAKAFLSRKQLRRVILPDTVEEIGDWAFAYCENLKEIELPNRHIRFGKSVFLNCTSLRALLVRGKGAGDGVLLAAAVTALDAPFLLDVPECGSSQWLARWDSRMLEILHRPDEEGYTGQVLCGEEDYGSTDWNAYLEKRRREKVRLLLLRLCNAEQLEESVRAEAEEYLRMHTKGSAGDETWQVILREYADDRTVYELFVRIGCVTDENFEAILTDVGADHPELKAYLMKYRTDRPRENDLFDQLEL